MFAILCNIYGEVKGTLSFLCYSSHTCHRSCIWHFNTWQFHAYLLQVHFNTWQFHVYWLQVMYMTFQYLTVSCIPATGHVPSISSIVITSWHFVVYIVYLGKLTTIPCTYVAIFVYGRNFNWTLSCLVRTLLFKAFIRTMATKPATPKPHITICLLAIFWQLQVYTQWFN